MIWRSQKRHSIVKSLAVRMYFFVLRKKQNANISTKAWWDSCASRVGKRREQNGRSSVRKRERRDAKHYWRKRREESVKGRIAERKRRRGAGKGNLLNFDQKKAQILLCFDIIIFRHYDRILVKHRIFFLLERWLTYISSRLFILQRIINLGLFLFRVNQMWYVIVNHCEVGRIS